MYMNLLLKKHTIVPFASYINHLLQYEFLMHNDVRISRCAKYLGILVDLNWNHHVNMKHNNKETAKIYLFLNKCANNYTSSITTKLWNSCMECGKRIYFKKTGSNPKTDFKNNVFYKNRV